MKNLIKNASIALAILSALLIASSCNDDLKPLEMEVDFSVSITPPQAQIEKEDQLVTTAMSVVEQEVECPRKALYKVSFEYDDSLGTLHFLGKPVQKGAMSLSSLDNLTLSYQAKVVKPNKITVTVTNDASEPVSKSGIWTINAADTYTVELAQEGEGTLSVQGAKDLQTVVAGTKLTVTATPADGWTLASLTANDVDIMETKNFVVTSATVVKAVFTKQAPKTYAVSVTKEGQGDVTITGASDLGAVASGTRLTVSATPASGWELKSLTANGVDILQSKSFVVTGATVVKAVFTKQIVPGPQPEPSVPKYFAVTYEFRGDAKKHFPDNLSISFSEDKKQWSSFMGSIKAQEGSTVYVRLDYRSASAGDAVRFVYLDRQRLAIFPSPTSTRTEGSALCSFTMPSRDAKLIISSVPVRP